MSGFNIVEHSFATSEIPRFIETKLRSQLPFSLPLYRRCQFHLKEITKGSEQHTQHGELWVAVARAGTVENDQTTPINDWLESWVSGPTSVSLKVQPDASKVNKEDQEVWLAAHIDLSNPGETQVWLYGSWESEQSSPTPLPSSAGAAAAENVSRSTDISIERVRSDLFESLYNHIRKRHVPQVSSSPTGRWQNLLDSGKLISVPYKRSKVLFGGVSEQLWPYLNDNVVYRQRTLAGQNNIQNGQTLPKPSAASSSSPPSCRTRQDLGYLKYIIPSPQLAHTHRTDESVIEPSPQPRHAHETDKSSIQPPPGFHYGPLNSAHLQLMLDRSAIPRTQETMQSLVSVGLFSDENSMDPIAWGILGKDASLSSLHTEPDFRGRGLAQYICQKLATLQTRAFRSNWLQDNNNNHQDEYLDHSTIPDQTDDLSTSTSTSTVEAAATAAAGSAGDDVVPFLHADVSEANTASRRVFEKLGGTVHWKVAWIEIDLGE